MCIIRFQSFLLTDASYSTQDRSFLCTDDPGCNFQTCDPASLLRHRKRLHGYIPRPSNGRKTAKVPTQRECESVSSMDSPLPQQDSLLFPDSSSPCSYNYAWDTSLLPELDFFSAEPEILQFQFPYQDQQEELKSKDFFLPLQIPNMEQIFPGYQTSGQLNGSHGLQIGLTDLELDTSGSGLDIRFDSGISWNTDSAPMTSSSCDFNSVLFDLTQPSPQPPVLATFTDAMYAQPHQAPSFTDPQTHTSPYSTDLSASGFDYFDHSQLTNLNHEVNSDFIDLTASGDYFDQCRWDFGFNPAFGIVQGSGGGFMF